jgi:dTDP-4-dehydrorhamnose 3,5-epimerase
MRIDGTSLVGVMQVVGEPAVDARGSFARTWCRDSFAAAGIAFQPIQASLSDNRRRHTLRGMHWQAAPAAEQKLVRCLRGAILDVAVDLRPDSPSHLRWTALRLAPEAHNALFIPAGCAHGFLTLTEDALVEYLIDAAYEPAAARGARWDDPAFGIDWPAPPAVISDRDRAWPDHAG